MLIFETLDLQSRFVKQIVELSFGILTRKLPFILLPFLKIIYLSLVLLLHLFESLLVSFLDMIVSFFQLFELSL